LEWFRCSAAIQSVFVLRFIVMPHFAINIVASDSLLLAGGFKFAEPHLADKKRRGADRRCSCDSVRLGSSVDHTISQRVHLPKFGLQVRRDRFRKCPETLSCTSQRCTIRSEAGYPYPGQHSSQNEYGSVGEPNGDSATQRRRSGAFRGEGKHRVGNPSAGRGGHGLQPHLRTCSEQAA
jgi:hypothetical protein